MVAEEQPDPNHPTLIGGLLSWWRNESRATELLHCEGGRAKNIFQPIKYQNSSAMLSVLGERERPHRWIIYYTMYTKPWKTATVSETYDTSNQERSTQYCSADIESMIMLRGQRWWRSGIVGGWKSLQHLELKMWPYSCLLRAHGRLA